MRPILLFVIGVAPVLGAFFEFDFDQRSCTSDFVESVEGTPFVRGSYQCLTSSDSVDPDDYFYYPKGEYGNGTQTLELAVPLAGTELEMLPFLASWTIEVWGYVPLGGRVMDWNGHANRIQFFSYPSPTHFVYVSQGSGTYDFYVEGEIDSPGLGAVPFAPPYSFFGFSNTGVISYYSYFAIHDYAMDSTEIAQRFQQGYPKSRGAVSDVAFTIKRGSSLSITKQKLRLRPRNLASQVPVILSAPMLGTILVDGQPFTGEVNLTSSLLFTPPDNRITMAFGQTCSLNNSLAVIRYQGVVSGLESISEARIIICTVDSPIQPLDRTVSYIVAEKNANVSVTLQPYDSDPTSAYLFVGDFSARVEFAPSNPQFGDLWYQNRTVSACEQYPAPFQFTYLADASGDYGQDVFFYRYVWVYGASSWYNLTFDVQNPAVLCNPCTFYVKENSAMNTLGPIINDKSNRTRTYQLSSLPKNGTALAISEISYLPNRDFFNVFSTGAFTSPVTGVLANGCGDCPEIFNVSVMFSDNTTRQTTIKVYVTNVFTSTRRKYPPTYPASYNVTLGKIGSLTGIVLADPDQDEFNVGVCLTSFGFALAFNVTDTFLSSLPVVVTECGQDVNGKGCETVCAYGPPSSLNTLLSTLVVNAPTFFLKTVRTGINFATFKPPPSGVTSSSFETGSSDFARFIPFIVTESKVLSSLEYLTYQFVDYLEIFLKLVIAVLALSLLFCCGVLYLQWRDPLSTLKKTERELIKDIWLLRDNA